MPRTLKDVAYDETTAPKFGRCSECGREFGSSEEARKKDLKQAVIDFYQAWAAHDCAGDSSQ